MPRTGYMDTHLPLTVVTVAVLCLGTVRGWAAPLAAQARGGHGLTHTGVINGQVVDQLSRVPLGGAIVNLIGTHLRTATDSAGRFSHPSLGAGTYILEVRAIGYGVTSWMLRLSEGEAVDYVFELAPMDVELEPVVVEGQPAYFQRRMQEFEERRRSGRGIFITHDDMEASHAATMADVLRGVPGVRLNCRSGVCNAQMTRTAHGVCNADWVVDGVPASMSSTPHLPVVGIVAVEIYRSPSEAPAEFLKADSQCGVIAIWTKSGP
jgi:CarboxypepD_reg-like domain/TonB-dependent Receptor Plug Domain